MSDTPPPPQRVYESPWDQCADTLKSKQKSYKLTAMRKGRQKLTSEHVSDGIP